MRGAEGRRLTGRRSRPVAAALALFAGAVALAGCGLGPGSSIGDVGLRITRDYGAERVSDRRVGDLTESDTVMRVLDRSAEITTRYGGGFVQSIDGVEGSHGGGRPPRLVLLCERGRVTDRSRRLLRCAAVIRSGGTTGTGPRRCRSRPLSAPGLSPSATATRGSAIPLW